MPQPNSLPLAGQVIVIVGASSGMGRATALAAAAQGAQLILAARNGIALDELCGQIKSTGGTATAIPADATKREDIERLITTTMEAHGRIDALINSVGTNLPRRTIAELTDASWQRVLDINLTSAFHITQASVPVFRQQKEGLLIHIASSAARKPDRSGIAYQATKAGVAALAHGAMEEERENGLRVTVIYPGMTDTPLVYQRPTPPTPDMLAKALQPEDVAAACLFVLALPPRAHVPELVLYPSRS